MVGLGALGEVEAILVHPGEHIVAAALEHHHVERVDPSAEQNLGTVRRGGKQGFPTKALKPSDLDLKSLQCPIAGAANVDWLCGQRDQRAEGFDITLEREVGDVSLDTVFPRNERRRLT